MVQPRLLRATSARSSPCWRGALGCVITVSEFSRSEIVSRLDVPEDRVTVVPNGVDERFSPAADAEAARRALQLERPYVLVVGTRIARKNLAALDGAAARCSARAGGAGGGGIGPRLHARRGRPRDPRAGLRAGGAPARALHRGVRARHAVPLRGVRAALHRGDGLRHAGGGGRSRRPPGGVRPRRAARGPHRRRRAGRRPSAAVADRRWRTGSSAPGSSAPRATPGAARRSSPTPPSRGCSRRADPGPGAALCGKLWGCSRPGPHTTS